jgi:hypothetical protein
MMIELEPGRAAGLPRHPCPVVGYARPARFSCRFAARLLTCCSRQTIAAPRAVRPGLNVTSSRKVTLQLCAWRRLRGWFAPGEAAQRTDGAQRTARLGESPNSGAPASRHIVAPGCDCRPHGAAVMPLSQQPPSLRKPRSRKEFSTQFEGHCSALWRRGRNLRQPRNCRATE